MAGPSSSQKKHLAFLGRTTKEAFTSPITPRSSDKIKQRNRTQHGERIKELVLSVQESYEAAKQDELPEGIIKDEGVYVEFYSDFDVKLAFDSFQSESSSGLKLLSSKEIIDEEENVRYSSLVYIPESSIGKFIAKVDDYLSKETKNGRPRNEKLINNIQDINLATLRSFFTENKSPFPSSSELIWWEVWLRRKSFINEDREDVEKVIHQLKAIGATISNQRIDFPEHTILLVSATPEQLSGSVMLLDNLAELRLARETTDFFTKMGLIEQDEWIEDLKNRIENHTDKDSPAICIIDSGVQNGHVLLKDFLLDENTDAYKPAWGKNDSGSSMSGHGTPMAGLALYGDLTPLLANQATVQIFHQLESVKILHPHDHNEPPLYGDITTECVARAFLFNPERKRLFCMAVSCDYENEGKPSSWSSAVDQLIFGRNGNSQHPLLFFVSSGNVDVTDKRPDEFPDINHLSSIEDPGNAFNAVTVGAYTEKAIIDLNEFPNSKTLSSAGGMCASNRTSMLWKDSWPNKPDIVFEGGNHGVQDDAIIYPDSLTLLSTSKNVKPLCSFCDTSASTALASNFAAQVLTRYPDFWPETVRGLMVHSAEWTNEMLGNRRFGSLNSQQKRAVLRVFGYGAPNLNKALYSASNSLTLIAERVIQPFVKEGSSYKFNEMHLFELPWPQEALFQLSELNVKMTVTLSYYIEPNPGNRNYSSKFNYQSQGLKFDVIRRGESLEEFRKRVNKKAREEDEKYEASNSSDNWMIGIQRRTKGSIHKDIWEGSAADLATKRYIAIYPVTGWWKTRPSLNRFNNQTRYCLIISVDTGNNEVDIYTPVLNEISVVV